MPCSSAATSASSLSYFLTKLEKTIASCAAAEALEEINNFSLVALHKNSFRDLKNKKKLDVHRDRLLGSHERTAMDVKLF